MLEPLTMRCIVSGSTLTSASMTIEQPTRMQSEAAVTSLNVASPTLDKAVADADQELQHEQLCADRHGVADRADGEILRPSRAAERHEQNAHRDHEVALDQCQHHEGRDQGEADLDHQARR